MIPKHKRQYIETLKGIRIDLYKNYGIFLDRRFDPRRWLRSFQIEKPEIVWYGPKQPDECSSLDFWLKTRTKKGPRYNIRLKYKINNGEYYPVEYEHSCPDTFSTGTSGYPLFCKHLYAALRAVEELDIEEIKEIMFIPNENFLTAVQNLEKSRKYRAYQKLQAVYFEMGDKLTLEEGRKLKELNKVLFQIKKV